MPDQQHNPFNIGGSYGPGLGARPPRNDSNFSAIRQLENQGRSALNRANTLRGQFNHAPIIGHVAVELPDGKIDVLYNNVPEMPEPVIADASLIGLEVDEIMDLLVDAGLKDKSRIDGVRNHLVKGLLPEPEEPEEPDADQSDDD